MSRRPGKGRREDDAVGFAEFRFFPETGELFRGGARVALGPKPTAILALLLERPGRLVERERLHEAAWPSTLVEFDQGLNSCIRQIRRALGDDAREPRFVETIPRRGYRFIHAVNEGRTQTRGPGARRVGGLVGAALALVVVAGTAGEGWLGADRSHPVLARIDFDVASESAALEGLDRELERQVWLHLTRHASPRSDDAPGEPLYLTGTLIEAEDGALLRAILVRARDGEVVWAGSFNPLCERAPSDPGPLIGAYLARVVRRS